MRQVAVGLSMLLLAGCATNALRVEYATNVSAREKVAVAASRNYLSKVDETRQAANLDIVALDPTCVPDTAYVRKIPTFTSMDDLRTLAPGWLCVTRGAHDTAPDASFPYSLAPIDPSVQPIFELLNALSSYYGALDKILDDEAPTAAGDLSTALALGQSGAKLFGAVTGKPVTGLDSQLKAVDGLLGLLATLEREQDKVDQLRSIEGSDAIPQLLATLVEYLKYTEDARWENSRQMVDNAKLIMTHSLSSTPPPKPDVRRELVKAYYARAAAGQLDGALYPALSATIQQLADADADFRRVMADHPNLTREEKRKLARITSERVGQAFDALAAIVLSFKGA